jgi:exopolysaccharide production protein ExoQ
MNPSVASLICACGIAGLFYLDRDRSVRTSKALWLPVVYLWILGSRSVSAWLGVTPTNGTNVQLDGSPLDAAVFGVLLAAAIGVLIRRNRRTRTLLATNWPILIYFFYCLVSVAWSYYPDVAFKRWIKASTDVAMALIIVTDGQPVVALRRLFSRVGFLLLPTSVLFINYYGGLGRGYDPGGEMSNTGVTTNKNALGLIVFLVSLGALWHVRALLLDKKAPNRSRRLVAQATLLTFGLVLLEMAHCATAIACFALGGGLILATGLRAIKRRPARVHVLCLGVLLVGALMMLFGGQSMATSALGRQSNFSGRTEIWAAVISAVSNPIVGDGFESFWIGPDVEKVWRSLSGWWHPEGLNEAHNGYIEVYADLGWIGCCFIVLILITGYRRAVAAFRMNPTFGGLMLALVIVSGFYNITESAFFSPHLMWFFLLLAMFSASAVAAGHIGRESTRIPISSTGQSCTAGAIDELLPRDGDRWPATGQHLQMRL